MKHKQFKRKKSCSKKRQVKEFICEMNKTLGWEICDCAVCRGYHERLYDLSHKIINKCDLSNTIPDSDSLNNEETKDCVFTFAVEVGRCIIHPPYLYKNLGNWCPETGYLLPGQETNILMFLQKIIGNYSNSMTPLEKRDFGEAVSSIENLFVCSECDHEAEIVKTSD